MPKMPVGTRLRLSLSLSEEIQINLLKKCQFFLKDSRFSADPFVMEENCL